MKKNIFLCLLFLVSAQLLFSETKVISSNALGKVIEPKLFTEETAFQNVSEQLLVEDFDSFVYSSPLYSSLISDQMTI